MAVLPGNECSPTLGSSTGRILKSLENSNFATHWADGVILTSQLTWTRDISYPMRDWWLYCVLKGLNLCLRRVTSYTPSRDHTYDSYTKTCQKLCTRRALPQKGGHAPTFRDLQDQNDTQKHTHHRTEKSEKATRRPKLILELSKAGENQHLPGDKGVCEQQAVRVTTYGGLKWRLALADGLCEVRDGMWG